MFYVNIITDLRHVIDKSNSPYLRTAIETTTQPIYHNSKGSLRPAADRQRLSAFIGMSTYSIYDLLYLYIVPLAYRMFLLNGYILVIRMYLFIGSILSSGEY